VGNVTDLIVVYDPVKEVAAIVDPDNRIGIGPAAIGPDSEGLLSSWLETIPYDPKEVDSAVLRDWFEQFSQRVQAAAPVPDGTPAPSPVEPASDTGVAAAKAAEQAATATAASPPPAAPADTDMDADQGEAATVTTQPQDGAQPPPPAEPAPEPYSGPCPACSGSGQVPGGEPGTQTTCNLCHGTGNLPAPATV
jgi:hypothetical protein